MKSIMNYLNINKKTAHVAKDRLQIIIAQQRSESDSPDYLPLLKKEILEVIAKYTHVNLDNINVNLQCKDNNAVLELNDSLPETTAA